MVNIGSEFFKKIYDWKIHIIEDLISVVNLLNYLIISIIEISLSVRATNNNLSNNSVIFLISFFIDTIASLNTSGSSFPHVLWYQYTHLLLKEELPFHKKQKVSFYFTRFFKKLGIETNAAISVVLYNRIIQTSEVKQPIYATEYS